MCGQDCNIITNVSVNIKDGAVTTHEPAHGAKPQQDPPTAAHISAAALKDFTDRMDGGCDKKKCKCNPKPGSVATTIDRQDAPAPAPAKPWEPFTLYFPPNAPVGTPNWVVKGHYQAKYTI